MDNLKEEKFQKIKANFIKFLNDDFLFSSRKNFGMFGQIQWWVVDIDKEFLTIHIEIGWLPQSRGFQDEESIARHVCDSLRLLIISELLPCPQLKVKFRVYPKGLNQKEFKEKQFIFPFHFRNKEEAENSLNQRLETLYGKKQSQALKRKFEVFWKLIQRQ